MPVPGLSRVGAAAFAIAGLMLMGAQSAAAQTPGTQPPPITQPPGTPPSVTPGAAQGADLSVTMRGEQDCVNVQGECEEHGVYVRENTNYRLTVHIRNGGPGTATNVRAQIRTPKEFEVERVTPNVCDNSRYCEIGTLQSGQDAVITLRGEYHEPTFKAHNWVFVASDSLDPDHGNNEAGQHGEAEEPEEEDEDEGFTCFGKKPTIRGDNGSEFLLNGDDADDVVATFGGSDFLLFFGGADRVCSGAGDDLVIVQDEVGDDFVDCGPGVDQVAFDRGDVIRNCEIPVGPGDNRVGLRSADSDKVREFLAEHDVPREVRKRIEELLDD